MEFFGSILASIIATILLAVIGFFIKIKIDGISAIGLIRTVKLLITSNIKYFYSDRKYLRKYLGTTGEFISSAKVSITYVGFWLSGSIDNTDILNVLKDKI